MTPFLIALVIGGASLLIVLWLIVLYNSLVRKKIAADGAWADIDVQLKRRYDLVPNLVSTVKGYAAHEKEALERVMAARNAAMGARTVAEHAGAESVLTQAIGRLFAVAEAYPDLKANQNFLHLQEELTSTENRIGFARQHYNRSAGQYNEGITVFPANIVAGVFNFRAMDFFELHTESQREAPKVSF
jgi:LemA protein